MGFVVNDGDLTVFFLDSLLEIRITAVTDQVFVHKQHLSQWVFCRN